MKSEYAISVQEYVQLCKTKAGVQLQNAEPIYICNVLFICIIFLEVLAHLVIELLQSPPTYSVMQELYICFVLLSFKVTAGGKGIL